MQIVTVEIATNQLPRLRRALRANGFTEVTATPVAPNQTIFGRLPFTSVATRAQCIEHREAQCEMFGAAREAGLDTGNKEAMLDAINFFLGLQLSSRTQMTPDEMRAVTGAIKSGFWRLGWQPRRVA